MARPRDPRRDKAKDIWLKSSGKLKLVDLAERMGVTPNTIRKWKATDKWDNELKGSAPKSKRSAPKRSNGTRGAPKGNQNAKGNIGGRAPLGNKNAVTTGEFESLMWDYLDEDEKTLFSAIPTDPLFQMDMTIRELTIRQRRMMKRVKKVNDGLGDQERRVLQRMRKTKSLKTIKDKESGEEVKTVFNQEVMTPVEVEDMSYRKIDDILHVEEALTRITDKLIKAVKQKQEFLKDNNTEALKLELLKIQIDHLKNPENEDSEGWIASLKAVANKRRHRGDPRG